MKMNMSVGYGLMAAGYLAEHADESCIKADRMSKEYGIPLEFLIKILHEMVKQNVLSSKRGPGGGFTLARPAKEISLLEIIESAGGPIGHTLPLTELTKETPLTLNLDKVCKQASDKVASVFGKVNLGQMVGK